MCSPHQLPGTGDPHEDENTEPVALSSATSGDLPLLALRPGQGFRQRSSESKAAHARIKKAITSALGAPSTDSNPTPASSTSTEKA